MARPMLTLDFFHDVVCGWCFNLSPRLRTLSSEFALEIIHHTFVLQETREQMIAAFGSMPEAKETILGHWQACKAASDTPERINIAAMRAAPFEYPWGLVAAKACKAAERQGGQEGHWALFDALQQAHLTDARNVADPKTVLDVAASIGFDGELMERDIQSDRIAEAVSADQLQARKLHVRSVPTVIVRETGMRLINTPLEDLREQLLANMRLAL
ncbi:DsbA family protein [Pseudovibrio sp. SPO723]|uniref:DsbA family oxidoreductase n=1 Tax=Nesiotobacter zosterae TaxID=392721 RepID=UPI0029C5895B|nr:DsbA family protein [Pseudovibrio sp. SPO723]MDX5594220.1 DsbA family protein [Pseudovibrio sp. SPO723]